MSTKLAQARLRACQLWPFASHAILSMVPVPRPGQGTLAVDKFARLYFDEAALEAMTLDEAAGVILHELDHLLKRHHKRGEQVTGGDAARWDQWNTATDAAINSSLRAEGVTLPVGMILPESIGQPDGLAAEEYFRALLVEADAQQPEQPDDSAAGDDGDNPQPQENGDESEGTDETADDGEEPATAECDAGSGADADGAGEPQSDAGAGEATGDTAHPQPVGTSGSCSDGRQRPWELGPPSDEQPGLDEADQEQLIHVTAKNVMERSRGDGAGHHRQWAEQILDPPIDPAAKLMHLVRRACDVTVGTGERSFRRPSRRNGDPRMVLPSSVGPLPRITVIVDTSGSMGERELATALGTIRRVLQSFRIRDGIRVVCGDVKAQSMQLCMADPRSIALAGGGGTDLPVIIAEVLDEKPRPQLLLAITDGWTLWPAENPGVPIVACITGKVTDLPSDYQPPSWMTTLELGA